jgi:glycosyltransferase involved in cell wall biosynthesis
LELIRAFDIVRRRYEHLRLHLIGGFAPESFRLELSELIRGLGLQAHVSLDGQVPYGQVKAHLADARVGVVTFLPYSNNRSCLPNKLFEYMACGLPVVASDFPLYRDVVADADFGVLVNPAKPESVAEGITRLVSDPARSAEMSANARAAFRDRYNWESESRKLLGLYARI